MQSNLLTRRFIMRRIWRLLAVFVCLAALAAPVRAEEETPVREPGWCGEEVTWSFEGGTLTLSGSGKTDDFPDGAPWQDYKDAITKVVLTGSISYLGEGAFADYDGITSVSLGNALQELGKRALYSCDGLTELTMPASFRVFGEESLMRCAALKEIHCLGGMPSFRLNCLWDTWVNIYYPVANPWPLQHIEQLEEAFQGRIEFLAEDGTDPYTPTEETTEATTETTEATTEAATEPVTEPSTEAVTVPATEPSTVPATQPTTEAPTEPVVTQLPTEEPEPQRKEEAPGWIGAAIVGMSISLIGLGALLFGGRKKPRKGGKYSR